MIMQQDRQDVRYPEIVPEPFHHFLNAEQDMQDI